MERLAACRCRRGDRHFRGRHPELYPGMVGLADRACRKWHHRHGPAPCRVQAPPLSLHPAVPEVVAIGAIALLFIAPFVWACTPLASSGNILPSAGPQQAGGGGMGGQANGAGPAGMTGTVSTSTAPQGMPVREPVSRNWKSISVRISKTRPGRWLYRRV